MLMYTTTDLRKLFNVRRQTISNWCIEFAEYLSPTADRTGHSHRRFSEDDVRVLATIHELRGQGILYESIHLALKSGQRANLPDAPQVALSLEVNRYLAGLQSRIMELEGQLNVLEKERAEWDQQRVQLERERNEANVRAQQIMELYERIRAEMNSLQREMGRLEAQIPRKAND